MKLLDVCMIALLAGAVFLGFTHGTQFLNLPMWARLGIALPFVASMFLWITKR